jgi:hypothetical protein
VPLPLSLAPQNYSSMAKIRQCAAFAQVWFTLHMGGGPRPGFGLCAWMCLACTFDLIAHQSAPGTKGSRLTWHLPKWRKNWGQLSRLVLMPAQHPRVPKTMTSLTSQQTCRCIHIALRPPEHKSPTQPSMQMDYQVPNQLRAPLSQRRL